MKRAGKTIIWALVSLLLSAGTQATTPEAAQYQGIMDRNVFNLHPPPEHSNVPPELPNPPPKVTLDGITTILGKKITFLTVAPTKPGTLPQTLMLAEGRAEDDVEVIQIDEKAGIVKVINHGKEQTLDFDHKDTKPMAASSASPVTIPLVPAPAPADVQLGFDWNLKQVAN